ncbi:PREDICTED: uncharacterized protein LOC109219450 [Nicotiana attenuata]|uniref:uncharacterized protein LOC109219450 n=1 Tax=Nicotiana attenuata TaxID=49451 RepID=UPI000905B53E|nr:PREDICTED: uncharacterized protein LOC109219450 [Nicotiana attenuata]
MVKLHKPMMLVLLETKMADHKKLTEELQFDMHVQFPAVGFSGGIVIMWKETSIQVDEIAVNSQGIHAMVKVLPSNPPWLLSAIYASNVLENRLNLWDNLLDISHTHLGSWFVGEDFNEVLKAEEKFGGNPINTHRSNSFWNCINNCHLIDLGFKGSKYTWSNKRYKTRNSLILERIDRCLANNQWVNQYPEANITHLPRTQSHHCPMLVSLSNASPSPINKPFRFESMWCSHPMFQSLVRDSFSPNSTLIPSTALFKAKAVSWNRDTFGNIFHKKRRLLARIARIQKSPHYPTSTNLQSLETQLIDELNSILKNEEDFWKLKSRIQWLSEGNANTNFFHASTLNRMRRNKILSLQNDSGQWMFEEGEIHQAIS